MENKCTICGQPTDNKKYCGFKCRDIGRHNQTYIVVECPTCKKTFETRVKRGRIYCSVICASKNEEVNIIRAKNVKKALQEKYGVDYTTQIPGVLDKMKATTLRNHGVEHYSKTDEFKRKCKETMLDRHGVEYAQQSSKIRAKTKKKVDDLYGGYTLQSIELRKKVDDTIKEKYNVSNARLIPGVEEKIKATNLNKYNCEYGLSSQEVIEKRIHGLESKYGVSNISQVPAIREIINAKNKQRIIDCIFTGTRLKGLLTPLFEPNEYHGSSDIYKFRCNTCQEIIEGRLSNGCIPRCYTCFPPVFCVSQAEKEVYDYIKSICPDMEIIANNKTIIAPQELDIYIPEKKLAIEFNGLYWHSELNGKDSTYHIGKTKGCNSKGIRLLHIQENEWIFSREIVKSIIRNSLNVNDSKIIYARKCQIQLIDNTTKDIFLDDNHLQGIDRSSIRLGLFFKDELVSVMTFVRPRFNKNYQYELSRYAIKNGYSIVGGAQKLFKHAIHEFNIDSIITYSDKRYFTGHIYKELGFTQKQDSPPRYTYLMHGVLYNRMQFQKHKLSGILETFDPNLTEWQNMQLNGYDRIWDCGNHVFEYHR